LDKKDVAQDLPNKKKSSGFNTEAFEQISTLIAPLAKMKRVHRYFDAVKIEIYISKKYIYLFDLLKDSTDAQNY
jgi:hypothetical protein